MAAALAVSPLCGGAVCAETINGSFGDGFTDEPSTGTPPEESEPGETPGAQEPTPGGALPEGSDDGSLVPDDGTGSEAEGSGDGNGELGDGTGEPDIGTEEPGFDLEDTDPGISEAEEYRIFVETENAAVYFGTIPEVTKAEPGEEYLFEPGEPVELQIVSDEGYELKEILADSTDGEVEVTAGEAQTYEFLMPESDVSLRVSAEKEDSEEMPEEMDFFDGENALMAAAAQSQIKVSRVTDTTAMNPDYAFCYGFRNGSTRLINERGGSAGLLSTLKKQFQGAATGVAQSGYACDVSGNSSSGAYVMRYTNVGDYRGKKLDLRITVMGWGKRSMDHVGGDGTKITPSVVFSSSEIAINMVAVLNVQFKFEFLQNGTNTVLNDIQCHMTMQDIDAGQKVYFYDNNNPPDHIYLGTYPEGSTGYNYLTRQYVSDGNQSVSSIQSGSGGTNNDDTWGWAQVDYTGALYFNYFYTEYGALTAKDARSCVFRATPKILGKYTIENPEKKVGPDNSSYEDMGVHWKTDGSLEEWERPYDIQAGSMFTYAIEQRLLPGTYRKFEVEDILDACLIYRGARVMTASGYDVTENFSISAANNTVRFTANSAFLNRAESFNDVTYHFFIQVTAKDEKTISNHGHYNNTSFFYIKNTATRTINSSVKNTNVSYVRGTTGGNYYVKKVDAEDPSKLLTGAKFMVYEWNGTGYSVNGTALTYDSGTGMYRTGALKRTAQNEGKYRIVEVSAPEGYEGSWSMEFNVSETPTGTVFTAENEKILPSLGTVKVTKKVLASDITWAHGNPVFRFCLTGTDTKGVEHTYEDYVEFQPGSYRMEGSYAVMEHVFQNVPVGTYLLTERETIRYRFQRVTADTANVSISGSNANIALTGEQPEAAATFINDKTNYSYYSHSDVIKNSVPIIW